MSLVATLSAPGADAVALDAAEMTFERRVGGAVRLRVLVHVSRADEKVVAGLLQLGSASVEVGWEGSNQNISNRKVLPPCFVVGARRHEVSTRELHEGSTRELQVDAVHTALRSPALDSLTPRWRVHRKGSLGELLRAFPDVTKLSDGVAYALDQVSFPLGDSSCIVQCGLSDWQFVRDALSRYGQYKSNAHAGNIVLTGGTDDQRGTFRTLGRDVCRQGVLRRTKRHRRPRRAASRRCLGRDVRFRCSSFRGSCPLDAARRHGRHRSVVSQPLRARLGAMVHTNLPLFTSERRMIWRTSDRLIPTGDNVEWRSTLHILPEGSAVPVAEPARAIRPWTGTGTVQKRSPTDPWITVQLRAPYVSGEDQIDACLTTVYRAQTAGVVYISCQRQTPRCFCTGPASLAIPCS